MTKKKEFVRFRLYAEMSVELENDQLPLKYKYPCHASVMVSVHDFSISFLCKEKTDFAKSRVQLSRLDRCSSFFLCTHILQQEFHNYVHGVPCIVGF